MSEKLFYYHKAGQQKQLGPFNVAQLKEESAQGRLATDDIVSMNGTAKTHTAANIKGLFDVIVPANDGQQQMPPSQTGDPIVDKSANNNPEPEWYYEHGEESCGPIEFAEIVKLAKQGVITVATQVWHSDLKDWTLASSIGELLIHLKPVRSTPPPLRKTSPSSDTGALKGVVKDKNIEQSSILMEQGTIQLRSLNFKLAESTFAQLISLDSSNINGWLGKSKAIAHQTYFGSPDSLLKNFRMEDRSEEALICIQMALEYGGGVIELEALVQTREEVITICVDELLKGSKAIADTCVGNWMLLGGGPIKKGFLTKSLNGLSRCLELSPSHPESLEYHQKVSNEMQSAKW